MVASVAAVTFERRASDGRRGVLTLSASLGTVIPAANLIVAVALATLFNSGVVCCPSGSVVPLGRRPSGELQRAVG